MTFIGSAWALDLNPRNTDVFLRFMTHRKEIKSDGKSRYAGNLAPPCLLCEITLLA
jgi:hypothetical protein